MNFYIDKKIFDQYPDLKVGLIIIKYINSTRRISAAESLLRGICAKMEKDFVGKNINDDDRIQSWNKAFGYFGINPNNFSSFPAKLLEKAKNKKEIPHGTSLDDLCNYFTLKYLVSVRGKDMDWLCGDLRLTYTASGEPFRPRNSIEIEMAQMGEVAYMDDGGIISKYWNHEECERTKLTPKTANAIVLVEDISKMHIDEFGEILRDVQNSIIKYIGGQIETYLLTEEGGDGLVELGIEGRKNVNDGRIPQQEKIHFLEEELKKNRKELLTIPNED